MIRLDRGFGERADRARHAVEQRQFAENRTGLDEAEHRFRVDVLVALDLKPNLSGDDDVAAIGRVAGAKNAVASGEPRLPKPACDSFLVIR
jgi:hypothetical protein